MTYGELMQQLIQLTPEQLETDVTVYVTADGEFYPLVADYPFCLANESDDVLDDEHPYLVI